MDEHGAGIKHAEQANQNGGDYLVGNSVKISVNGKSFEVSAEHDVFYSANEID